jgi:hypothetical protein
MKVGKNDDDIFSLLCKMSDKLRSGIYYQIAETHMAHTDSCEKLGRICPTRSVTYTVRHSFKVHYRSEKISQPVALNFESVTVKVLFVQ